MEATLTNENPKHASVACPESANHSAAVWMAEAATVMMVGTATVRIGTCFGWWPKQATVRMAETATVKTAETARS